ncbi:MAG: MFS transporter [Euryarchaeota archaeon RBG_19FT_COMBO_56_21]|nr:MAG: MFS transporter [Euryarchaeota archaeon RBG_19FT_COMBO_56_21]
MDAQCASGPDAALKRSAMTVAVLSSFVTPFMASSINVAILSIGPEFSMDAVLLSWVATSYLLSSAAFLVPFGRIADIKGRKKVFLYGSFVMAVASLLCAFAFDEWSLIAFRVVQGIGGAMIFGTSVAILSSVYPPNERGKALGTAVSAVYVGLSAGPFLGGFMTEYLGWRSLFLLIVPLSLVVIYVAQTRLKGEWAEAAGEAFDLRGSVTYAASLTAVVLGFTLLPSLFGAGVLVLGTLGMVVFVLIETRVRSPVLDIALFLKNRTFAFSNLAALINYSATFAVTFIVSLYLYHVKGLSYWSTGAILVAQPVVMAVFSPLAGKLSDMKEPRLIASSGMAICTAGLVMLSLFTESTEIWVVVVVLAILGFGFALFSSPNTNAIMGCVQKRQYGIASASVGTMRLVGQVLSMGIATIFIALYVGEEALSSEHAAELMDSYRASFYVFAALCVVGVFASLARGRRVDGSC